MHCAAVLFRGNELIEANAAFLDRFGEGILPSLVYKAKNSLHKSPTVLNQAKAADWITDGRGNKVFADFNKIELDRDQDIWMLEIKPLNDPTLSKELGILFAYSRDLFNNSLHAIAFLDKNEKVLDINPRFEELFEYSKEEMVGKDINDFIIPGGFEEEIDELHGKIFANESFVVRLKRKNKSGELIEVEAAGSPVFMDGEIIGLFAMYIDRRVETMALQELKRERAYFKQLFDNSPDAIVLLDDRDAIINFNRSFEQLFEYSLDEVKGITIEELIALGRYAKEAKDFARYLIQNGKTIKAETIRTTKTGKKVDVELLAYPIYLDKDRLGAYAFYRDISDRKAQEQEIRDLIYRDSLTGIYNRKYAYEVLDRKLAEARTRDGRVAFLYFDLEGFKKVNDARGHSFGDVLLTKIARRIREHFTGRMEVCRVGGDEFLAIINNSESETVEEYIEELKKLFDEDFIVKSERVKSGLSIGYAIFPEDGNSLDHLIFIADKRMYREKKINRIRRNPIRRSTTLEELMEELE